MGHVKNRWLTILAAASVGVCLATAETPLQKVSPAVCVPAPEDYSFMWWAHGWRGRSPEGTAVLCFQTGRFGMALDVAGVRLRNLGRITRPKSYAEAAADDNRVVFGLPAAELTLEAIVGRQRFRCVGGEFPSRIIESGRFFQRCDVLGLEFRDEQNHRLEAAGRLEVAVWPDRASLLLELIPNKDLHDARLSLQLVHKEGTTSASDPQTAGLWKSGQRQSAWLAWSPNAATIETGPLEGTSVRAADVNNGDGTVPVTYEPAHGWFRVELPREHWQPGADFDHLERVRLQLINREHRPKLVRLLLAKDYSMPGITGMSPMLRDAQRHPTGIPVQISKNWHTRRGNPRHRGPWFHGLTMLRLPPDSETECEFSLAYAHWGGVPAASHAQLCLVGWGADQLWDEVAVGCWGESICYEPDVTQKRGLIDDVRPLMVWAMKQKAAKWNWTNNVGGGDFLVYFDETGKRQYLARMRTEYTAYGPNLTRVTYAGVTPDGHIAARLTVSTPRADDLVRAFHRFRYDVLEPTTFRRLAFYQLGADRYNDAPVRVMVWGNTGGAVEHWKPGREAQGTGYARTGVACQGPIPWFSLQHTLRRDLQGGAYADRGLVIRSWKARLGGEDVPMPTASMFRTPIQNGNVNLELGPPPGLERLLPGDFVEAEVHLLVMPATAEDYYGPNGNLRAALARGGEPWKMIHREATGNDLELTATQGTVLHRYPIVVQVDHQQQARLAVTGGIGYVPLTLTGLRRHAGWQLWQSVGGEAGNEQWSPVDQSVHGNDFWQTDYDPLTRTWRVTYNVSLDAPDDGRRTVRFRFGAKPK